MAPEIVEIYRGHDDFALLAMLTEVMRILEPIEGAMYVSKSITFASEDGTPGQTKFFTLPWKDMK